MMKHTISDIETTAAEWAAREDGGPLHNDRQRELDAWLAEDARHLGAYLKMRAVLLRVERMGFAALQAKQKRLEPLALTSSSLLGRWRHGLAGGLACVAVIALAVVLWNANTYDAVLRTAVGQTKIASMPDGSIVTLNTDSEVAIHYSPFARGITLKRGEVLFDVAKHKLRPFVVKVADAQVRAVGTSFTVMKLGGQPVSVMVRDGVIEITNPRIPSGVAVRAGARAVTLPDGWIVITSLSDVQVAHDLDWLEGHIFFRRKTLAAAAKEFERYSAVRIVVDDPSVDSETITGMFVATDPAAFAKAVSIILDLKVESSRNRLQLSRKQP